MPRKKRKAQKPKLITDPKTGLRITKSATGTKVTSEDVRYERLKRRRQKMSPAATKRFWEEERGERAENNPLQELMRMSKRKRREAVRRLLTEPSVFEGLIASPMHDGSIVIQGMLPDGKYLVLEVYGKKVKVAFYAAPADPNW